jgi:hypothetical protein
MEGQWWLRAVRKHNSLRAERCRLFQSCYDGEGVCVLQRAVVLLLLAVGMAWSRSTSITNTSRKLHASPTTIPYR